MTTIKTSTGQVRICCPFCLEKVGKEDHDFHLYISLQHGLFICHRCKTSGKSDGSLRNFVFEMDNNPDMSQIIMSMSPPSPPPNLGYFPLDSLGTPPVGGSPSYIYLTEERKLSDADISYWDIRSGVNSEGTYLKGRVVVPVKDERERVVYYSARTYTGHKIRYVNPKRDKRNLVFNYYRVQAGGEVIVCEGVFSAMAVPNISVATLGSYFSQEQFYLLSRRFKTIFLALDGDIDLQYKKRVRKTLLDLGSACGIVPLYGKEDPDNIGREEFLQRISQTKIYYPNELILDT